MDEPFAAIDPLRRLDLNKQVQRLREEYGCTTLWVTHDIVEALQFATRIIAVAPPPVSTTTIIDLEGIPPILDNANLPAEALRLRDRILEVIKGGTVYNEEEVLEAV
jgi:ABC-type nitrate/sulfonate/bicarbonate transport system ATPase subunit